MSECNDKQKWTKQYKQNWWKELSQEKKALKQRREKKARVEKEQDRLGVRAKGYQLPQPMPVPAPKINWKNILIEDFLNQPLAKAAIKRYEAKKAADDTRCECHSNGFKDCGEHCSSAEMDYECNSFRCSVGHTCSNRWAQIKKLGMYSCIIIEESPAMGLGLKAYEDIPAGTVIGPYLGELIELEKNKQSLNRHHCSHLAGRLWVDASEMGNKTRFINRSCKPNCTFMKRDVNGLDTLWIVSNDNTVIKKGDFLSFDYLHNKVYDLKTGLEIPCQNSCCVK